MPRPSRRWLLTAALLWSAWPGSAFVRVRHPDNGNPLWRTDARSIAFLINERTPGGLTNSSGQPIIAAGSDPLAALRAAMDTWTSVTSSTAAFQAPGSTSAATFTRNGEHIISFVDSEQNRTLVGDALAVTVISFTFNGDVTDTDILFNPARTFSTNNLANTFDLQSVATHELGHALGAGHSGILAATMYQAIRANSSLPARLAADDIAFATSAYPEPGLDASLGSVPGVVRFLDDGRPLFGALIVAADPNTGVTIGSISNPDGSFELSALPPGFYYLYAEPADGPVNPASLPSYYGSANNFFRTAFLGGPSRMFPLGVTAGANPPVNFTVVNERPRHNIDFIATTAVGSADLSNATQGPLAVRAGETLDFVIAGAGLDTDIPDADLLLAGAGVTIRPGSIRRNDIINGRASIRMTIQAPANAPFGAATIIIKGAEEASALSGALRILGGGGPGPSPGPTPTPFLTLTPSSLRFTAPGTSQIVQVDGTPGLRWSATAATTSGGNWLVINPASGSVPGTIEVFAIAGDLTPGEYAGRITVSAAGAASQAVEVTFVIVAPPAPLVFSGGVVNAASFVGGGVAPGEIVTILGRDMGPRAGNFAGSARLRLRLGDVTVYFSGLAAPLFFAAYDQINAQVPYEVAGLAAVELEIEYQGRRSEKVVLRVLEAKPGLFTYGPKPAEPEFPSLNASALNEDNTHNTPSNPARIGSIVQLFLTGQGVVSPPVATGEPAPNVSPAPAPPRSVLVTIGGLEAPVVFAGLAPGSVGVLQVNAVIPEGSFPRDNAPVIVTVGSSESQTNVTLAVR